MGVLAFKASDSRSRFFQGGEDQRCSPIEQSSMEEVDTYRNQDGVRSVEEVAPTDQPGSKFISVVRARCRLLP